MEPRVRVRRIFAAVAAALWICAAAPPIRAQETEEAFYKGKTVRLIVGFGPGGGFDVYARMIAPYLSQALGATVVVENQPGAGGIAALDNLVVAPPDGLQIMLVDGTAAALGQLVGFAGVRFDLGKVGHLGTAVVEPWVWLIALKSPIKTPQDAINAHTRMMWSAGGAIGSISAGAAFTCEALALDCRIVMGYPDGNEAALAVSRGEMDAIDVSDTSANNYVKAGQVRAVAMMGRRKSGLFPDTPTIFEALRLTPDQEWLFDFFSTMADLGKILVVPPNLPAARLAYLQAAVKKALSDPALIAEGERTERYVDYLDAEPTREAALKVVEAISPEQRQRVRTILSKFQ